MSQGAAVWPLDQLAPGNSPMTTCHLLVLMNRFGGVRKDFFLRNFCKLEVNGPKARPDSEWSLYFRPGSLSGFSKHCVYWGTRIQSLNLQFHPMAKPSLTGLISVKHLFWQPWPKGECDVWSFIHSNDIYWVLSMFLAVFCVLGRKQWTKQTPAHTELICLPF